MDVGQHGMSYISLGGAKVMEVAIEVRALWRAQEFAKHQTTFYDCDLGIYTFTRLMSAPKPSMR